MSVFVRLSIDIHYSLISEQRVLVAWALDSNFADNGPYTFTLQRALSATGPSTEWEDVATCIDQAWIYDTRPLQSTVTSNVYYRVKLVTPQGTHYSQSQGTEAYWSKYDWSLAREIVRKEDMLLRKRTGSKGWLIKRKNYGDTCTVCTDPVTHQIMRSDCTTCYGTGIVGGYYDAMEYWLAFEPSKRMRKLDKDIGIQSEVIEQVRGLAYPLVEGMDVWVQAGTNRRFYVQKDVVHVAKLRGIPLIAQLVLEQVPGSHVLYNLPVPGTTPP